MLSRVNLLRTSILLAILLAVFIPWVIFRPQILFALTFIRSFSTTLLTEHFGRTNFLLLGISGEGHEGPSLADTIIFGSVGIDRGDPVLITLPRDLWVPSLRAKLNTAYHYGLQKGGTFGGFTLVRSAITETIGQQVDYIIVIDFSTFSKAIDLMGGLDVNIEKGFVDTKYPVAGKENDLCEGDLEYKCRYETLTYSSGIQHFNGDAILKYVRSRHSEDLEEGTDFARSKRQSQIISAIKAKMLHLPFSTYQQLWNLFSDSVTTNIAPNVYPPLIRLAIKIRNQPLKTAAISETNVVYNPPISNKYDRQWILLPRGDDPQNIFDFVAEQLK